MSTRIFFPFILVILFAGCGGDRSGGRIVFQSNRDGNFELYVMNAKGENQRRITNSPANDVTPSWSPDGKRILFASDRDGNWEIYTVFSDGSHPTRLTTPPGANTAPSWAAGGEKILFVSTRDAVNGDLYLMDADGQDVQRVSADPSVKDTPVMTPGGNIVLFTMNEKGRLAIAAYSVPEKSVRVLTSANCNSMNPSIEADGQVVFSSDQAGNLDLYTMTVSGENIVRLTTNEDAERTPAWAHGGQSIIYARRGGLHMLALDNRTDIALSTKGDIYPHWTPH